MIWLDAHLSPRVARWIREELGRDAQALREIGLRDAEDEEIFDRGKAEDVVILIKDKDFVDLVRRLGSPPSVIRLRCGNTTEDRLKQMLTDHLDDALRFIDAGDDLVEIQ